MATWHNQKIVLSFALGMGRNATNDTMTIDTLVKKHFTKHKVHKEKDSGGFSCELIDDAPAGEKGKNLKNANAKAWPLLAYDFDDGTTYEDAKQKLRDDGVAFLGYSSFNHMRAKGDAAPVAKFRIVIFIDALCRLHDADPLESVIRGAAYKRAYHAVESHYGWHVDKTCSNPARFFYLPAHDGSEHAIKHAFIDHEAYETGTPLDFEKFFAVARAAVIAEREAKTKHKEAREAKRAKKQERHANYGTEGFDRFVQDCGPALDAKEFVTDYGDGAKTTSSGIEAVCPNQDAHTGGGDNRATMYVFNAGDKHDKGGTHDAPHIGCNHATCNLTTWDYIDQLCQAHGLTVTDLLPYVPDTVREAFDRNTSLPRGFRRKAGRIEGRTLGADPIWLDLCRDFTVGPRVHDENGAGWGTEIVFKNDSGADVTAVILKRDLQKIPDDIRAELANKGLDVSTIAAAKARFIDCLNTLEPTGMRVNFTRSGWHGAAFVTGMGEVITDTEGFSGKLAEPTTVHAPGGSREGFNKDVLGKLNDPRLYHLQLGILIGCAGPLMKLLGLESRLIYLGGVSKRGKTTTQGLSVAVWSSPKTGEGLLHTCKATLNGLEAMLARGRDQTTALDEMRQMDEKPRQNLIFNLAAGHGKGRMRKDLTMQTTITWDAQIISLSGEQSVSELLGGVKGRVAGESVRMPSIDVGTLKAHDPRYVDAIKSAMMAHFGWLGPDVVRTIIKLGYRDDPTALRAMFEDKRSRLVRSNEATQHESMSVFALLWTTGELLQKAKLVPDYWNIEAAVRWACDTFNDSSEARRMQPTETALEALLSYLTANPSRFPLISGTRENDNIFQRHGADDDDDNWRMKTNYQGCEGWRDCKNVYYVLGEAFERIVGAHTNTLSWKQWAAKNNHLQARGRNYTYDYIPGGVGYLKHVRVNVPTTASMKGATPTPEAANDDPPGLRRAQLRYRCRPRYGARVWGGLKAGNG